MNPCWFGWPRISKRAAKRDVPELSSIADRPKGVLDVLASKLGIGLAFGFLVAVCLGGALYTQSVVTQLKETHQLFEDRQIRNGHVAMSDIQRLLLVVQKAVHLREMTPELTTDFLAAADIVYVRYDHLRSIIAKGNNFPEQQIALQQLERIVEIADHASGQGFSNLDVLAEELLTAAEEARVQLVQYLDVMRRQADAVMFRQSKVLTHQQMVVLASLAALTLAGCGALFLLRLEIIGRRARERAERRVKFLAFFDPLTRLPNRVQFQDRLQAMLEKGQVPLALLSLDLDEFKTINDTYGHAAGDMVLKHVANIFFREASAVEGFAARLAGDEFAMVVPSDDMHVLSNLCDRILKAAANPFKCEGDWIEFGVSIGLATTTQVSDQMSTTVDGLSRVSDFALYASKTGGRNRYTVYDQTLETIFLERRSMLDALPKVIKEGDLWVFLQPKVTLPERRVYGFEALVRWERNGRFVEPDDFILLAEESGLVVDIDNFVLNEATKAVAAWNEKHGTEFSVSVNLSTLNFNSQRIVQWVEHVLWRSDIRPDLLTLEITESTEMRDWEQARTIISKLRSLGCKISIDDFGKGYSSLAYLRSMAADELKIDRSLVEEIETSEKARLMLASVFDIARNLELGITVEGIETPRQVDIISAMGTVRAQGFLFGRPLPCSIALRAAMASGADGQAAEVI